MSTTVLQAPQTDPDSTLRVGAIGSVALLVIMALWLGLTNINGAVVASGKAVVHGNPKSVQSLDGGLIRELFVSDGMQVEAGQVLLSFDPTLLDLRRDMLRHRLAAALAKMARLEAEYAGLDQFQAPVMPDGLSQNEILSYIAGERSVFEARQAVLDGRAAQAAERNLQLGNRIDGIEAQLSAVRKQHRSVSEELAGLEDLSQSGLIPQSQILELQRREADLSGRMATLEADLAEQRNAISETELEVKQSIRGFQESVVSELLDARAEVEEQRLEIARVEADLDRIVLRAPVDGIVHEMQVSSVGGVVAPEREILKIIPVGNGVDFEVWVDPTSIDSVYAGQKVELRFPAFDQRKTPFLVGSVASISPDTITDPATRRTYYSVGVEVSEEELARLGDVALIPGMPINAFLQTHARSVLSYLIEPLAHLTSVAFRED